MIKIYNRPSVYFPYLQKIGLKNFRLFKEDTEFELAPITILTGINNSGKSSLIKSLQLMKSNFKDIANLRELNFTGGRHNLGSFSTVMNRTSDSNQISFKYEFPIKGISEPTFILFTYRKKSSNPEFGELQQLKIETESKQNIIELNFDLKYFAESSLKIDFDYLKSEFSKIFSEEYFKEKEQREKDSYDPNWLNEFQNSISNPTPEDINEWIKDGSEDVIFNNFKFKQKEFFQFDYENDGCYEIVRDFNNLSEIDQNEIINKTQDLKENGIPFSENKFKPNIISLIEENLKNLEFSFEIPDSNTGKSKYTLSSISRYILHTFLRDELIRTLKGFFELFNNIGSVSSVRANSERLYSSNSDIVDINSLLIEYSKLTFNNNDPIKRFVDQSLLKFNIGEEIIVNRHQGVASEIFVKRNGENVLLADLGFGFTQLVPIILKIAVTTKRKEDNSDPFFPYPGSIFLLEEPESNLHPSYQSKLAELILDASRSFNIQFIIETHSEYLIRNFQYLTATKTIPSNATKIYYFHQPGTEDFEKSPYREIEILKDGRLSNEFGEGFFDEIPRLLAFLYNSSFN